MSSAWQEGGSFHARVVGRWGWRAKEVQSKKERKCGFRCRKISFGSWMMAGGAEVDVEKGEKVDFWMGNPTMGLPLLWDQNWATGT